ncbi:hypothetical protein ACSSS7_004054 [Eimeria intestinalis]
MAANREDKPGRALLEDAEPTHSFLKYFDSEGRTQVLRTLRCLYILWFFNVAATMASFALALTITFHPLALNGAFNWRVVHVGISVALLTLAVGLGVAGAHKGSSSLLYQSCVAHILLSISSLVPFIGNLSILLLASGDTGGPQPAARAFYRQLFTALCSTGGVSAVVSLMCALEVRAVSRLLWEAMPPKLPRAV